MPTVSSNIVHFKMDSHNQRNYKRSCLLKIKERKKKEYDLKYVLSYKCKLLNAVQMARFIN